MGLQCKDNMRGKKYVYGLYLDGDIEGEPDSLYECDSPYGKDAANFFISMFDISEEELHVAKIKIIQELEDVPNGNATT